MQLSAGAAEFPLREKFAKANVFIVDDEPIVVEKLTYFLESAGFERIYGFCSGSEAIGKMRFISPDLIFTDIHMPEFNGNMLAKTVRQFPHLRCVPIIAVTADPSFAASHEIIRDGAQAVLGKPVKQEVLVKKAIEAIENTDHSKCAFVWKGEETSLVPPQSVQTSS
jgi:two-component system response regulator YesN